MDQDCIRCVEGNRNVTAAILKERFDMIFYTGSPTVGKVFARAAAEHLTPCVLELGGKVSCVGVFFIRLAEFMIWFLVLSLFFLSVFDLSVYISSLYVLYQRLVKSFESLFFSYSSSHFSTH